MKWWVALIIVVAVVAAVIAILTILGKRAQKKQEAQREQIEAAKQSVNMLVIDKKRMPLKEAGLPKIVMEQAPKRAQRAKVPVVKAKIGPRIMTFIADEDIYDLIPVKAQIRAMVSGIYITSINIYRKAPVPEPEKKGFMAKLRGKANSASKELNEAKSQKNK